RILRLGDVDVVAHQLQVPAFAQVEAELEVGHVAARGAVLAPATGIETRDREVVAEALTAAQQLRGGGPGVVGAVRGTRLPRIAGLSVRAPDLHHPARRVAVQGRERPAQHFDAVAAGQAEVRDLALAIRHRGGDAIGVQAQAAHAEGRARAEA